MPGSNAPARRLPSSVEDTRIGPEEEDGARSEVALEASILQCVLYGVGTPYVYEVFESLRRLRWSVAALVANVPPEAAPRPGDLGEVVAAEELSADLLSIPVFIPLLTPGHRKQLLQESREIGLTDVATVVDPTATVASTSSIGEGTHVNAGAVVGAVSKIGRCCIVNRSASVGHHVTMEDFVSLGPGCVLCGSTTVGAGAFVGAGAVVNPKISVGPNSIVGAGAVVVRDVPPHCVVVGNPARVIREGIPGYNDVSA